MWLSALLAILLGCVQVQAKAVFAHFMVENAKLWSVDQWKVDIRLAQAAHIDGFALNIRADDTTLGISLSRAFQAADDLGFKMIFSYDYAGGGPWSSNLVVSMTLLYSGYSSYYTDDKGRPVVSTFEGPSQAGDWEYIIKKTNAAFVPDWSSLGAKAALDAAPCVPHGLFSWAPWPWGNTDGNTYVDASYIEFIEAAEKNCGADMQYMMPASPWFYTNLPGYDKNWLWRGDDLWFDRWEQIRFINPDYVEIISWNDFGESHHIGPLYVEGDSYEAFTVGKAPFNYALDMPHDGWRELLPFTIDLYKTGVATISQEKLVAWYRVTPKNAPCDDGWTTGNTASQLQFEFTPQDVVQDKIFYSALLASNQAVTVTVGGVDLGATWTKKPSGGAGIYHGSVDFGVHTGAVVVTVGSMTVDKRPIKTNCEDTSGYINWNAFVASTTGAAVSATVNSTQWVCIEGTAAAGFDELCTFTCKYGYCPVGACLCTKMGPGNKLPGPDTPGFGTVGFPAEGRSASYGGLCSFACNYGFGCPNTYCDTVEHPLVVPNVSPFTPDACTSGVGEGGLGGLCGFSCNFGFCPIHSCTCTSTGALNVPPAQSGTVTGEADPSVDQRIFGPLCEFACSRGYCPEGVCVQAEVDGNNPYKNVNPAYIGTRVYESLTAACESPCVLVLPPSGLPSTTTIRLPPYATSFEVGSTTTTVTLYPSDIVTDRISFSNINITGSVTDGVVFPRCTSMKPDAVPITLSYVSNSKTTVTIRQVELPPWPQITQGPPDKWTSTCGGWVTGTITNDDDVIVYIPQPTSTMSTPIPTYTNGVFPPSRVEPIVEPMDNQCRNNQCPPENNDDGKYVVVKVRCDELWFFIFCIDTEDVKVYGWKFTFPKSVIGPGPPPLFNLLPKGWGFIHPPKLPHWPKITVGPGLTYPDKPTNCDDNKLEVPVEIYTRSYGLSVSNGVTVTTTTRTITETAYETGCPVPEYTTTAACTLGSRNSKRQFPPSGVSPPVATATPAATTVHTPALVHRAGVDGDDSCEDIMDAAIYFTHPVNPSAVIDVLIELGLSGLTYHQFKHHELETIFIYVKDSPQSFLAEIIIIDGVANYLPTWEPMKGLTARNAGAGRGPAYNRTDLDKRAVVNPSADNKESWHRSLVSSYPGQEWNVEGDGSRHLYYHDGKLGEGQYIYNMDTGVNGNRECAGADIAYFDPEYSIRNGIGINSYNHGTEVALYAVGQSLGIAPRATWVLMADDGTMDPDEDAGGDEVDLIRLLGMINDIEAKKRQGKCVLNISIVYLVDEKEEWKAQFLRMLRYLHDKLQCVVVGSAGNEDKVNYADDAVPASWLFDRQFLNLVVAASASKHGLRAFHSVPWSDQTDTGMVYAPGLALYQNGDELLNGTSLAAPMISSVVAYLRALDSPFADDLRNPVFAVKMVKYLSRKVSVIDDTETIDSYNEQEGYHGRIIWNGNVELENCLVGYGGEFQSAEAKFVCEAINKGLPEPGKTDNWVPDLQVTEDLWSGGTSNRGAITWHPGSVSPTCTANCGTLCTGYYCVPQPTGSPPDFSDPVNAIVTKTTSTTTKATTTKATSTAPVPMPLTRGRVNCFNEADFPGHADIQSGDQNTFSVDFSSLDDVTIGPGDEPFRLRRTDKHGVNYDFRAEWVAGCVTTVETQSFRFPLGMNQSHITAYLLVREDYTKCNNGGVGGSCQAGCLLYTFEGGRGDQGTDPCAGFNCNACGSPFDPAECQSCCRSFRVAVAPSQYPPSNHSHYVPGEDGGIVIDDLASTANVGEKKRRGRKRGRRFATLEDGGVV